MILIWDNGEQYSDHSIYFIDSAGYNIKDCMTLIKSWQPDGFLLGRAKEVKWFEGGAARVDDLITLYLVDEETVCSLKKETFRRISKRWEANEEALLARAKESGNKCWYENLQRARVARMAMLERCREYFSQDGKVL
jgi:hypothetical protein